MAVWLSGGLAAACFGCTLTAINGKMQGLAAATAIRLCSLAVPTLVFSMLVVKDRARYVFGWLAGLIPVAGVVAGGLGISSFLYSFDKPSGVFFLVVSFALVWLMIKGEDVAKRRRQDRRAAEALHLRASNKDVPLKL